MSRHALLGAGLLVVAVAGCGTDYDGTRERAEERAAAYAYDVEGALRDLVADGRAPTGGQLLALVRTEFPGQGRLSYVFGEEVLPDGAVSYAMAFDGFDESGGGGTSHQHLARLCVEYVVRGGRDPGVTMADTECSEDLLQPTGPTQKADATFPLPDRDPSPAEQTSRRSCQEHSGDPNTCPGG
jgi:hypothetical protein